MADYVGRLTYGARILEGLIPSAAERQGRVIPLRLPRGAAPIDVDAAFEDAAAGLVRLLARHRSGLVTIGVDDQTRPNMHTRLLLPRLLRFLRKQGVPPERLRIIVAGGTHRPPRTAEYATILGDDVWREYGSLIEPHDCERSLAGLGLLEDGVPVEFNGTAAKAAIHIALTDLDYHYFAGVAGGPKQLMPGLAGRAVITAEHLRMFGELGFAPNVDVGIVDGNPVYEYKRKVLAVIREHFAALGHDLYGIASVVDPAVVLCTLRAGTSKRRTERRSPSSTRSTPPRSRGRRTSSSKARAPWGSIFTRRGRRSTPPKRPSGRAGGSSSRRPSPTDGGTTSSSG